MLERFARRVAALSVERPLRTIAIFAVVFAIGLFGASRLGMRLNYMELLPDDDEAVIDLRWVMKKAGSEGYLVTSISGGTRDDRLKLAEAWTERQSAMKEFHYAEYRYDVAFFRKHAASLIPLDTLKVLEKELDDRIKAEVGDKLAPLSEVDQSQLGVARRSDLDDVQA